MIPRMACPHVGRTSIQAMIVLLCFACDSSDAPSEAMQVRLEEGTNFGVTVSPDGQELVLDLQGRLWIMSSQGGEALPLTDEFGDARHPAWSPDGGSIAFQGYWDGNWHIYVLDRVSGALSRLTEGSYDHREPAWSPDGTRLSMASDRLGNYDIWIYTLQSDSFYALHQTGQSEFSPSWSPDGRHVAYVRREQGQEVIRQHELSTGQVQVSYATTRAMQALQYATQGAGITFTEQEGVESRLRYLSLLETQDEPDYLSAKGEDVFPFKASWYGDVMYYTASGQIRTQTGAKSGDIPFHVDLSWDRTSYVPKPRDFDSPVDRPVKGIHYPKISPDGRSVAFVALCDIWIQQGDDYLRITEDPYLQLAPCWSPDGGKLAFASDLDGESAIYVYDLTDGTTAKMGTTSGLTTGMDWSPDGRRLAYAMNYGPRVGFLREMRVADGTTTNIARPFPYSISAPSWHPSGERLAAAVLQPYSALYREGINRMILIDHASGEVTNMHAAPHQSFGMRGNDGPRFSPDGQWLSYVSQGQLWIVAIDADGQPSGAPEQLTEHLADAPSWTGDSKSLLYMATDTLRQIEISDQSVAGRPVSLTYQANVPSATLLVRAGLLWTASSGLLKDQDVYIEGNRITAVDERDLGRQADQVIDASDQFVMPGLIDIHAHQGSDLGEVLGRQWLAWGVTSTRDPATNPYDALNRREAQMSQAIVHPRIFFTGSPIDGNRVYYNGTYAMQSLEQLDMELRRARALDYDLIKTYVRLPDKWQRRVVEFAHAMGVPVTSHELYPAVSYGVDGVEHIMGTSRRGYSPKMSQTFLAYGDVTTLIARAPMAFTPTLGIYVSYKYLMDRDIAIVDDPRFRALYGSRAQAQAKAYAQSTPEDSLLTVRQFERASQVIADVHDKGGLIAAGTDSPIIPYGLGLQMELEAFELSGLTPEEVLKTATTNGAKVLGATQDLGEVKVGMLADLLILDRNPLEGIKHLRSLRTVILNGEPVEVEKLLEAPR